MSDEKLLPCPFCGGEPELHWINEAGEVLTAWVSCKCGCEHHERLTKEVAVKKWNSRCIPNDAQTSLNHIIKDISDDKLFNIATEAWSIQTDHSWSTDGLEAAVLAVRSAVEEAPALPSTASEGDGAAAGAPDIDHPDCVTDRERELYNALMGLASHACAHHDDYRKWMQGGVTLEPIVSKALRLLGSSVSSAERGTAT